MQAVGSGWEELTYRSAQGVDTRRYDQLYSDAKAAGYYLSLKNKEKLRKGVNLWETSSTLLPFPQRQ